jgi:hypothetical protein
MTMPDFPGDPKTGFRDLATLRRLLLEGAASPLEGPVDAAYFDDLRRLAVERAKRRSKA